MKLQSWIKSIRYFTSLRDVKFDQKAASYGYNHVRIRFGSLRGERVAVKQVSLSRAKREILSSNAEKRLRNEWEMLSMAQSHPNVLRIFDLIEEADESGDSVLSMIVEECDTDISKLCSIQVMSQIASVFTHLHSLNIVHRGNNSIQK